MECECVSCGECGGTGNVWYDLGGKYIGNHHCDDLDEMEYCDGCGGTGITETCAECQESSECEDY